MASQVELTPCGAMFDIFKCAAVHCSHSHRIAYHMVN